MQGDLVNKAVRIGGNWGLMPFGAIVGSVMPATYMRGMRETFGLYPNEPNFPRWAAGCLNPLVLFGTGHPACAAKMGCHAGLLCSSTFMLHKTKPATAQQQEAAQGCQDSNLYYNPCV